MGIAQPYPSGGVASIEWPAAAVSAVDAPFATKTKGEVVNMGLELKVPLERIWSCYSSGQLHCGICPGGASRKQAYEDVGANDPTCYSA